MNVTFSDESKMSFNGKSELSTECSKVTAIDFLFAVPEETTLLEYEPSTSSASSESSFVSAAYTLYERAASEVATNAATTYLGFFLRAIMELGSRFTIAVNGEARLKLNQSIVASKEIRGLSKAMKSSRNLVRTVFGFR